jgi:tetratricopeptide (TPR) repeat protein
MDNIQEKKRTADNINPKRKRIFSVILILFPLLFFLLIEFSLRIADYGDNYNLFEDYNYCGKTYRRCNHDFGKKYFNHVIYTTPGNELFLKEKPKNGFRIFVIGSSTVVGFPYGSGVMFPRILHDRLQDSYPDKRIEVINTAMTAINSYTFQDKINEILEEEPDVLLIYGGQNEFYGALGIGSKEALGKIRWIKILHLKLLEFKTYQLLRNIIFGAQSLFIDKAIPEDDVVSTATLMEKMADNKNIEFKSKIYNLAHKHYRKNMKVILKKARKKGVPVFFSELISNVKDLPPFGSSKEGNYPPASKVYEEGLAFERAGEYEKAKKSFYLAKDLDCIRFRASTEINDIVLELSNKYGAYFIPMKMLFEENSTNGLIGNRLLTEHVHPNIDGYFLMADAFYTAIIQSRLVGKLDSIHYRTSTWYRKNWGFTKIDSMYADILIQKLKGGWPFRPDTVVNSFMKNYKPKTIVDSLAYQAVRYEDISLESAHKKMAQYYIVRNEPDKAFQEYYSIMKIDPFNLKSYVEAGDLLFQAGKTEKALEVYMASLRITRDVYVVSRIGEIYALNRNFKKAVPYLEEVRNTDPEFRKQTVVNLLYKALIETGETQKATKLFGEYRDMLSQQSAGEGKKEVILHIPSDVRKIIDQATRHLQANEVDKAYTLLMQANAIHETTIANRFLGDIMLQKKDRKAMYYLKKVYVEYNTDPNYLNTLCYASIFFKEYQYAKKILPELKQLSPNNPNIPGYEKMIMQNNAD